MTFFADNKWVLLFYGIIILLVYLNRRHFDIQNKIVAMYKTKIGLGLMDRIGTKYSEQVKLTAYIGIGAGFVGMIFILYTLIKNLADLLIVPDAQSAVSLIVPGVAIPGSPIKIPLIAGWIALFLVILVHEFSHGVVSRAHKIPVTSSGIFFLGPIMGAFVEPDEKKLRAASDTTQYSVFAAGPFSNVLLAIAAMLLLSYAVTPLISVMTVPSGIQLSGVSEGFPAQAAGLHGGMVITQLNGKNLTTYDQFQEGLSCVKPGDKVELVANNTVYSVVAAENPQKAGKGYLGVMASSAIKRDLKSDTTPMRVIYAIIQWIIELLYIVAILSLGIGLANLLPLGPVDGGRMAQTALLKTEGKEKGDKRWKQITLITLLILVINIFWPLIKWIGGLIGLLL
jgi:membrane-associated protease RseP (regulator of RpoE activity)